MKRDLAISIIAGRLTDGGVQFIKPHPDGGWVHLTHDELVAHVSEAVGFVSFK